MRAIQDNSFANLTVLKYPPTYKGYPIYNRAASVILPVPCEDRGGLQLAVELGMLIPGTDSYP